MQISYDEELNKIMEDYKKAVENYLEQILPKANIMPNKLHEAMRYVVFSGGKRIRPIITLLCCKLFSGNMDDALPVAAAVELIHTYSLVHDDLPAMDNDDIRRGKLTCHKMYGEAMAILTGDALLTKAFEILSKLSKTTSIKPDVANLIIETLAIASGHNGMIGGQVMDIMSEILKDATLTNVNISELLVLEIHKRKTAALISASAKVGAFVAKASINEVNIIEDFGTGLGLLFQMTDDLIDGTTNNEKNEKEKNKLTYLTIVGIEKAKEKINEFKNKTISLLEPFGEKANTLIKLTEYIAQRIS